MNFSAFVPHTSKSVMKSIHPSNSARRNNYSINKHISRKLKQSESPRKHLFLHHTTDSKKRLKYRPRISPSPTIRLRLAPLTTLPSRQGKRHRLSYPLSPVKLRRDSQDIMIKQKEI